MNQNQRLFLNDAWVNQHLEFDFAKISLNTTCQSQNATAFSGYSTTENVSQEQSQFELKQSDKKSQKFISQTKDFPISKKSRCFAQEINKVLKKNKLKNNEKQKNHQLWQSSYLNINAQQSKIHFKAPLSKKITVQNEKKIITEQKLQCGKSQFNLEQFLQKNFQRQNKKNALKKNNSQKSIKGSYFIGSNIKKKTYFTDFLDESQFLKGQKNKTVSFQNKSIENSTQNKTKQSRISSKEQKEPSKDFDKFIEDLQKIDFNDLNKNQIKLGRKSTTRLTVKQIRKNQIQKQNNEDNAKLKRSLKRALSTVSLSKSVKKQSKDQSKNQRLSIPLTEQNSFFQDQSLTVQKIHFDKLKQRVQSKMEKYKKIDEIRKQQEKQHRQPKSNKKLRVFSLQPKTILTIQGTELAESRNDKEFGLYDKEIEKKRRPCTALTRTGLQYDKRQSHRRRSSNRETRLLYLSGINNSANQFRRFSKTAQRQVSQLNQCKSDRVIRNLHEKYLFRQKSATSKNISKISRSPLNIKTHRNSQTTFGAFTGIQYEKITHKQIEKQKMKQKLFEIMVECEQEKYCNKKLMKGLNVFEDFCDNVGQGLKNISSQISQYLRHEQQ